LQHAAGRIALDSALSSPIGQQSDPDLAGMAPELHERRLTALGRSVI